MAPPEYRHFLERSVINIILGIIFIIGGLSGSLALRGTGSGGALAVVGGLMVAWGVFKMMRTQGESE